MIDSIKRDGTAKDRMVTRPRRTALSLFASRRHYTFDLQPNTMLFSIFALALAAHAAAAPLPQSADPASALAAFSVSLNEFAAKFVNSACLVGLSRLILR
jgi:hypothetical protein